MTKVCVKICATQVANRGEIAIRIFRAAADLGLQSVAVYSSDDALALHTRAADVAVALTGDGVRPYLDIDGIVAAAKSAGANAIVATSAVASAS